MSKVHKKLLIGRVQMLLRKNCNIIVDEQEIDSSLTISENYFILKDRYSGKISLCDISDYK